MWCIRPWDHECSVSLGRKIQERCSVGFLQRAWNDVSIAHAMEYPVPSYLFCLSSCLPFYCTYLRYLRHTLGRKPRISATPVLRTSYYYFVCEQACSRPRISQMGGPVHTAEVLMPFAVHPGDTPYQGHTHALLVARNLRDRGRETIGIFFLRYACDPYSLADASGYCVRTRRRQYKPSWGLRAALRAPLPRCRPFHPLPDHCRYSSATQPTLRRRRDDHRRRISPAAGALLSEAVPLSS